MQLYWQDYSVPRYVDAALHLADLAAAGRIAHLGATNFDTRRLAEMLDAGVPLAVHQVWWGGGGVVGGWGCVGGRRGRVLAVSCCVVM